LIAYIFQASFASKLNIKKCVKMRKVRFSQSHKKWYINEKRIIVKQSVFYPISLFGTHLMVKNISMKLRHKYFTSNS